MKKEMRLFINKIQSSKISKDRGPNYNKNLLNFHRIRILIKAIKLRILNIQVTIFFKSNYFQTKQIISIQS